MLKKRLKLRENRLTNKVSAFEDRLRVNEFAAVKLK